MANGLGTSFGACDVLSCVWTEVEPNIMGHALSKVEVVQEKKNMSSDSKLESSVNSARMFWRVRHFRTCSRGEMSIITVTVVQASKESVHIEMTASLLHVCYLYRTRKQERKACSVYILIARVQGRIKIYRGGERKGYGLRCEGWGGGGGWETTKMYRWPTNITTKSFNKHNNNNFLNTT